MISDFTVGTNKYLPLREVVFNILRQAILKGELKPGEHLMEVELAEKLRVSRTPIREAMRKLEAEGFVVMEPRKGAEVASITESDLNDVLEIRMVLENMAIDLACQRITKKQLKELDEAAKAFQEKLTDGSLTDMAQADEDFHEQIYRAAGNKRLLQVLSNMREQIYRYRVEYLKEEGTRARLVDEHQELTQAIRDKDADLAKRICSEHLENQRKAIIRSIRSYNRMRKNGL